MSDYVLFEARQVSLDPECLELGLQFNERVEENDGSMPEGHGAGMVSQLEIASASHWTPFETQSGTAAAGQSFQYCDPIASSRTLFTPQWTADYSSALGQRRLIDQVDSFPGCSTSQSSAERASGRYVASSALDAVDCYKLPLHANLQQLARVVEHESHTRQASAVSTEPVDPNDMPGNYESSSATTVANKEDGLRCDEPGCLSTVAFKRRSELRRHQLKHQGARFYACPVKSCRYRGSRAFYRADKFQSHLRSGHVDTTIAACPVDGCGMERPLRILAYHCSPHDDCATQQLRRVIYWSMESQTCPLRGCNATVRQDDVRKHLEQHDASQRPQASGAIESIGYDAYSLTRLCPFCKTSCSNKEEWIWHVIQRHLVKDQSILTQLDETDTWNLPHRLWKPSCGKKYSSVLGCGQWRCGRQFTDHAAVDDYYEEKLAALEPNEAIYPKRLEILRMWPDFWSHPVFDGDRPAVLAKNY